MAAVHAAARTGPARLARLLLRVLHVRLETVDPRPRPPHGLKPMTWQQQVGETLGFSPVHTNRTIQDPAEKRLPADLRRDQEVEILDWPGLAAMSEFDPSICA
ncbi:helix-turn-helix domain-containing protein [Caulobacter segnis]